MNMTWNEYLSNCRAGRLAVLANVSGYLGVAPEWEQQERRPAVQAILTALQPISEFVPQTIRPDFERPSPQAVFWLGRLALEVIQVEADGLACAEAVERPRVRLG